MSRETQFQGFAKALMSELLTYFGDFEDMEKIIAHRAYDLVEHTCESISNSQVALYPDEMIRSIPDLTELPKEQEHE